MVAPLPKGVGPTDGNVTPQVVATLVTRLGFTDVTASLQLAGTLPSGTLIALQSATDGIVYNLPTLAAARRFLVGEWLIQHADGLHQLLVNAGLA